jgi:hypothetical protein
MTASDALQRMDARYQREDWRGLAWRLRQLMGPRDALLAYNESQIGPLAYYWRRQTNADPPFRALLPGSPLVFANHPAGEIEARTALYRQQAERLWLLDHFAHMYDPPGHARAALERTCLRDPDVDLEAAHRIPVRVYWRDRATANRRAGGRYAATVDFGVSGFDRLQLGGGWSHVGGAWAWMSPTAEVFLRADAPATTVSLRAWHLPRYHDGQSLRLTIAVDKAAPVAAEFADDQPRTVDIALSDAAATGDIVRVELSASRSFDPAAKIGGKDHAPKSLLVDWIELR